MVLVNMYFLIFLVSIDIPGKPSQGISPTNPGKYDTGTTNLITGLYHKLVTKILIAIFLSFGGKVYVDHKLLTSFNLNVSIV